jgi:hypothetical protein
MIDRKDRISTFDFMEMNSMITKVNDAALRFSEGGYVDGKKYPSRWLELKKYLMSSKKRYHSAELSGVKVKAGTVAGRIMVTFDTQYSQITAIGSEDEPDRGCGLQSIDATVHEASAIIDEVILKWDINAFAPNEKVSII